MLRLNHLSILPVSLLGLAACAGVLDSNQPADKIYLLEPHLAPMSVTGDGAKPQLAVSVGAAPGLDTDRLLLLAPDARLNHYAAARWPDHAPEVFESLLRRTLESSGRYARVSGSRSAHAADWHLDLELRELYTVRTSSSSHTARLALSGYISCGGMVRGIILEASAGIEDHRMSEIVAAYQRALYEISHQLLMKIAAAC